MKIIQSDMDRRSMSHRRPQTPPRPGRPGSQGRSVSSPQLRVEGNGSPRHPYASILSESVDDWQSDHDALEDYGEDEIVYDDDEDEFGLPSISSMRRKGKTKDRPKSQKQNDDASPKYGGNLSLGYDLTMRPRANSSDIAEERNVRLYPSNKSEGKILRPQYKEILRGGFPQHTVFFVSKH